MFEFDRKQGRRLEAAARPRVPYTPFEGGSRRALLLWGEHCTECAAPDCFASCDLYEPRGDMRCRRFDFGIFRNNSFPSAAGYGAEVIFKRWGKLEAHGNAILLPAGLVGLFERTLGAVRPAVDALGALLAPILRDTRLSYAGYSLFDRINPWLLRRGRRGEVPDAFVIEIYNPGDAPVTLLFSMSVDRAALGREVSPDQLPRPLMKKLVIAPGYFREEIPADAFRHLIDASLPFGLAFTPEALEGAHLVFLCLDFVSYKQAALTARAAAPSAVARPAAKCVIFDLDNTLWDGILLEGAVALRTGIADTIRRLDERGILVSVASKNAREDAIAQLAAFGLDDYILCPAIGWAPKSESVRAIARQLDIGVDTLIFVDDNIFERDEVGRAVPGVEVLADTAIPDLLDHPRLQGNVTRESRARRSMYRQALVRESAAADYGDNYIDFLRSCAIEVEIRPDRPEDAERIAELVQRTNQLNFSGRKYKRAEVERILADPARERYVVRSTDRYGTYGIVGFCLARVEQDGVIVEDLMLSCRVQGKLIERALFHHLTARPGWTARSLTVNFTGTDRNAAARAVLASLGFAEAPDGLLRLEPLPADLVPDFIAIEGSYPSTPPNVPVSEPRLASKAVRTR